MEFDERRTNIYILRLQDGKYYVGRSHDPQRRYTEHLVGGGPRWTQIHKPLAVHMILPNRTAFDEDKIVKLCMARYGVDNVRGGSYSHERLNDVERDLLEREIWNATDRCLRCGRSSHYAGSCRAYRDIYGEVIPRLGESSTDDADAETVPELSDDEDYVWACEYCDGEYATEELCLEHEITCAERIQQDKE
jgi:hypothetical protein